MCRLALIATAVVAISACRTSLEDEEVVQRTCKIVNSAQCNEAPSHSDLNWIENNVFLVSCGSSSCHDGMGSDNAGMLDLGVGKSHASLLGKASKIEVGQTLVVASNPKSSYLLMMLQQILPQDMTTPADPPPSEIGFMPQASPEPLCCQKLDAVERWIMAGAQNN